MSGIPAVLPATSLLSDKPLRFTDSPQHYASSSSGGGGGSCSNVPTPSPRRKNSLTSNEDAYSPEIPRIERLPPAYPVSLSDYGPPVYSVATAADYYRPSESTYLPPSDYQ